jgi:hypothetical protein
LGRSVLHCLSDGYNAAHLRYVEWAREEVELMEAIKANLLPWSFTVAAYFRSTSMGKCAQVRYLTMILIPPSTQEKFLWRGRHSSRDDQVFLVPPLGLNLGPAD